MPALDRAADAGDRRRVLAAHVGGEAERRRVGEPDRFLDRGEADHPGERAEGLLLRELRVLRHVGEQRRREHAAIRAPAGELARAALQRLVAVLLDLVDAGVVDQRADVAGRVEPVARVHRADASRRTRRGSGRGCRPARRSGWRRCSSARRCGTWRSSRSRPP
jgi:hypothetical protein